MNMQGTFPGGLRFVNGDKLAFQVCKRRRSQLRRACYKSRPRSIYAHSETCLKSLASLKLRTYLANCSPAFSFCSKRSHLFSSMMNVTLDSNFDEQTVFHIVRESSWGRSSDRKLPYRTAKIWPTRRFIDRSSDRVWLNPAIEQRKIMAFTYDWLYQRGKSTGSVMIHTIVKIGCPSGCRTGCM